jgi:hypothetical protein
MGFNSAKMICWYIFSIDNEVRPLKMVLLCILAPFRLEPSYSDSIN